MTHVYLMPGMAANPSIFEYIKLPEDRFRLHYLEWIIPKEKESIEDYALRMTQFIKHDDIVLLGVSFGGILVQEMAQHIDVKRLIIVSSVKNKEELPRRMKLSRKLKLYTIIPTRLVEDIDTLAKFAFGKSLKDRVSLYKRYLSMNDRHYMSWALKEMVCWDQSKSPENIIHIHGDGDKVFPLKYIDDVNVISGGTHIMILTKSKWFNKNLPELIENDYINKKE